MENNASLAIIDHVRRKEFQQAVDLFKSIDKRSDYYFPSLLTITELALRDKANFCEKDIEIWISNLGDISLLNNVSARYLRGLYFQSIGEMNKAEENLNICLELSKTFKPAIDLLTTMMLKQEKYKKAEELLKASLSTKTLECHDLMNLAIALMRQNKLNEALEMAIKGKLISKPEQKCSVHVNLGTIYQELGKFEKAKYHYKKALSSNEGSYNAVLNLGVLAIQQKDFSVAESMLRRAISIDPSDAKAKVNLAGTLLIQNKTVEGWKYYEERLKDYEKIMEIPKAIKRWNTKDKCKELLLVHEQGFGDTFQFIRYAEYIKNRGIECSFYGPKKLHGIIKTSQYIKECYTSEDQIPKK